MCTCTLRVGLANIENLEYVIAIRAIDLPKVLYSVHTVPKGTISRFASRLAKIWPNISPERQCQRDTQYVAKRNAQAPACVVIFF